MLVTEKKRSDVDHLVERVSRGEVTVITGGSGASSELYRGLTMHMNKEGIQNNEELRNKEDVLNSFAKESSLKGSFSFVMEEKSPKVEGKFVHINIEGQQETGIRVHHPGTDVVQTWETRKGKSRQLDTQIHRVTNDSFGSANSAVFGSLNNGSSSSSIDDNRKSKNPMNTVRWGLWMIVSVFNRSPKSEDHSGNIGEVFQSPHANLKTVNTKEIGMKFIVEDSLSGPITVKVSFDSEKSGP
ncbi:hypothetical protein Ddye_007625 [Dipteronia dyeriana]|uniref:Uncharacterized protein n=1 Tax=Dipteronia dyeriana TaxID=168575 RepID=A0AAE0CRT4_9ROSI|nr:hypothetical protein Ddye_007625 [Dipteronia dyeriana]